MEAKALILTDPVAESAADELLASLSDIAYAAPRKERPVETKSKYKSRFFFKINKSLTVSIQDRARKFVPKSRVHIDDEVSKRLRAYKKELPTQLGANINAIREFFLTTIGPRSLAGGAGAIQAREVVQRMLKTEVDSTQFDKFERMSHVAVNIVMAKFVAKYYGLPVSAATKILADIAPNRPQTVVVPNEAYEAKQNMPRHVRNKENVGLENKESANKGKEQNIG